MRVVADAEDGVAAWLTEVLTLLAEGTAGIQEGRTTLGIDSMIGTLLRVKSVCLAGFVGVTEVTVTVDVNCRLLALLRIVLIPLAEEVPGRLGVGTGRRRLSKR